MLRQALIASDTLIVPFAPSLMDVRELGRVLGMVQELEPLHKCELPDCLASSQLVTQAADTPR